MPLVAHLGHHALLAGGFGQEPGFGDGMGQRLLHVHVLPPLHGSHGDHGVGVIGCRDDDRVDVVLLVQHDAEVFVPLGVRVLLEDLCRHVEIDVAQSDDVLCLTALEVGLSHSADADARDVELVTRGRRALPAQHVPRHDGKSRRDGGRARQEGPPGN